MHKRILAGIMAAVLMLSNPVFVQNVSATELSAQEQNVEEQSEETQTGEQQEEQGEETSKTEEISERSKEEQEVQNEEIKEDKELIEEQKKDNSKLEVQPKSTEDETQPQSKTQEKKTESKKEKTNKEEKKQTENLQEQVENDISVQGTDSFGELFADAVGAEVESQEKNNGYNIFSVEMKDKTATVSFETLKDATLVVGIYEEDGIKMLASGKTAVKKGEQAASVTIDISAMPNYYYVKAFLIESDSFKPLCTSYESPNYTREMQEFFKKTVDDFSEKEVLNLDEDKANNFAVYRDETKIIAHSQDVNQLTLEDNENNLYRIENADDTVTSLKAGDIFSYTKDDGSVLIVKIAQITVDGTTVNITGTKTSIEETFEYVKIDCEAGTEEATIDASDLEEGVVYNGIVDDAEASGTGSDVEALGADIEAKETKSLSHSFVDKKVGSDNANIKLSGSLNLKVESSVKLYASLNYQYLEVRMDYSARIGITLNGQAATKIPLVTITYHPVPGVYIELKPSFVLEAKAKAELSGTIAGVVGFNVSNNEGMKNITNAPTFTPKLGGEASVYLGFSLEPHIGIISESVADVGLNAELGAETTAKLIHTDTAKQDENKKHDCKNCIKGDINGKLKLGFKASLLNSNKLTFTYNDEKTLKIADYYYSMDYHQGGLSTCPHWSYRIIANVQGKNGVPLSGAKINQQYTTDGDGKAVFYLPSGNHELTVEVNGYPKKKKSIEVQGDAKSTIIRMMSTGNGDSSSKDDKKDDANDRDEEKLETENKISLGGAHSGAITEDGSLYMWGRNDYGQLGDGTKGDRSNPVKIMDHVRSVSLGAEHSGAITEDGSLYMWGSNSYGQLGTNDRSKPVKIMDHVRSVSLGGWHSGAITEDGSLYMWGRNDDGQLGDGTKKEERSNPVKIMDHVRSVSLGEWHSGAITEDGSLYMWGSNSSGQLGDGTTTDRLTPIKINDPTAGANGTPQSSIDTVQPLGTADNTATYQNLKPNETYLFYAVKSETEDDILKASNLLCLTEATSDADGNMSVPYALRESCEDPIFFIRSLSKTDLASAQVKAEDLAYNKKEQSVAPEVTFDGKILTPGVDYEVSGDITATDIGTYKIKITGIGEYTGSVEASYKVVCRHSYGKDWTIDKEATCTAEGRKSRYCTLCGAQADVTTIAKKAHEYQTATTKATTKADGKIVKSCKHCGQTTTTVIAHPKSVALKQTSYTYNKKNRKPSVTIEDTKGNKLKSGTDYTVSYPKKCKNVGRYTVTVKFKGNYQGTVKKSYQILPKGTSLLEVTAKKKGFTAKWKKQKTQTAGYELQYSTNKKFKRKQTKKAVIKKTKTTTYKAKKLKANKKYYIRIRTYQNLKVNGKTKKLYSSWSKAKSIKTKK